MSNKDSKRKRVWITGKEDKALLELLIWLLGDGEVLRALLESAPQTMPVIRY